MTQTILLQKMQAINVQQKFCLTTATLIYNVKIFANNAETANDKEDALILLL